jgi:hypothetical protein
MNSFNQRGGSRTFERKHPPPRTRTSSVNYNISAAACGAGKLGNWPPQQTAANLTHRRLVRRVWDSPPWRSVVRVQWKRRPPTPLSRRGESLLLRVKSLPWRQATPARSPRSGCRISVRRSLFAPIGDLHSGSCARHGRHSDRRPANIRPANLHSVQLWINDSLRRTGKRPADAAI